jgi:hypothetical protein
VAGWTWVLVWAVLASAGGVVLGMSIRGAERHDLCEDRSVDADGDEPLPPERLRSGA